jgi:hypothetical protein
MRAANPSRDRARDAAGPGMDVVASGYTVRHPEEGVR